MNILLTPELEQFIDEKVKSGKYPSASEVISDGLRLLLERDRLYKGRFEELKREIAIGIEAADRGDLIDGETAIRAIRAKLDNRASGMNDE